MNWLRNGRDHRLPSREAAQQCSPRRKPWVRCKNDASPEKGERKHFLNPTNIVRRTRRHFFLEMQHTPPETFRLVMPFLVGNIP
jgi:hypothetical protein